MGSRLLPRNLPELYAHALALEHTAAKRFVELERYMREVGMDHIADELRSIGQEEREQFERRTQNFYVDVAEHTRDDAMCAFAAEMAVDEGRHIARLERLLAREPDLEAARPGEGDVLPLKP